MFKSMQERVASSFYQAGYTGNPDGEDIYPNTVDHGYDAPLAGGTDVMQRLQNRLLVEQGREPRPENERLAVNRNLPAMPSLRQPTYTLSDGVWGVKEVLHSNPLLSKDTRIQALMSSLEKAFNAYFAYIQATYNWD